MKKTTSNIKNPASRKKVWILMGANDTGKSTIVRCLTGVGGADKRSFGAVRDIAQASGGADWFFIFIQSMQEGKKLRPHAPTHWANFIASYQSKPDEPPIQNFLVSLHDTIPNGSRYPGEDYVRAFIGTGNIDVEWLAFLTTPNVSTMPNWVANHRIANADTFKSKKLQPSTKTAGEIRKAFGWFR